MRGSYDLHVHREPSIAHQAAGEPPSAGLQRGPRPLRSAPRLGVLIVCLLIAPSLLAQRTYDAQDSPFDPPAAETDAAEPWRSVPWPADTFAVTVADPPIGNRTVRRVAFPSPRPSGNPTLDRVTLRWHVAVLPPDAVDATRPAVVLVHSLHPDAPIASALARTLALRGVHAFIVDLPGYGARRTAADDWPGIVALRQAAQGVADVRRACDAVAALPGIDPHRIVLQGTSLGSFPAAVAAGLGARHHGLLLYLGGANVTDIIEHGQKDAANFRDSLEGHGIDAHQRAALLAPLEPLHIAERLNPRTTWLLAARNDQVITPTNAQALATAIGLDDARFLRLPGNHYTAAFALPAVADLLARIAQADDPAQLENP